ncbi:MAG: M24 family metallopeptidase, partial [Cyclobacteriaceae bacterium]|nr:M24 family metallopeptidase [Cyclobacteriaceae bacterium]
EYNGYNGDITRCFPVSGKFTARQKEVYTSVLAVMQYAMELLKPGLLPEEYNAKVRIKMEEELIGLKLISKEEIENSPKESPAYKKYFMHGISHHLGIDVHDVGNRKERFREGMVVTVEPGIYIKEEGLGIRLENDVLITASGCRNLSIHIPIEIEEIEKLVNKN